MHNFDFGHTLCKILISHEKLIFRLSYVDFDGSKFLEAKDDEIIEANLCKFAPKIVEGIQQIINFTKKYK